jgi:hypothetical protein
MFGLFKKQSEEDKLRKQYKKLMDESYRLSTTDRKLSDIKRQEAEAIMDQLDELKKGEG